METILLSFEASWFTKLASGKVKYEYRKHFPKGPTRVYFYVSHPVKAVIGFADMGKRESLTDWMEIYGDRSEAVRKRIVSYAEDCRYAIPILKFQKTTPITLAQLRADIPGFVVPRMYYYLDGELLHYLERNCVPDGGSIEFSFDVLDDQDIC